MTKEKAPYNSVDGVNLPNLAEIAVNDLEDGQSCSQLEKVEEEQLTPVVCSGTTGVTTEDDSMSDDLLEQGIRLIRQAFAAEGKRAVDEFVANLQSTIGGTKADIVGPKRVTRHPSAEKMVRAPAGSGRVLCKRALTEAGNNGLTATKIHGRASGEYEKMLSISAVRNELAVGERLNPPIYKHVGGVWYLAEFAPAGMRIVS